MIILIIGLILFLLVQNYLILFLYKSKINRKNIKIWSYFSRKNVENIPKIYPIDYPFDRVIIV